MTDNDKSKKDKTFLPRSYGAGRPAKPHKRKADFAEKEEAVGAPSNPPEDHAPEHPDAAPDVPDIDVHEDVDVDVDESASVEPVTEDQPEDSPSVEEEHYPEIAGDSPAVQEEAEGREDSPAMAQNLEADGTSEPSPAAEEKHDTAESEQLLEQILSQSDYAEGLPEDYSNNDEPAKLIMPPPEEAPAVEKEPVKVVVNLVGIRFDYAGKIYHFDAEELKLEMDEWVIVRTEKGIGLGRVAMPSAPREVEASRLEGLRKVLRRAGKVDFVRRETCRKKEREAYEYCMERIETLKLPMKLVGVECFFDGSKYVFYFTAEGRVDFRELVKQLVARYPVRIEMRQIGVRHESKMTGGLACCGQELCCSRFLTEFRPVSVKMAKNQNLSLNPTKISGVCGRLMCCLGYEHEIYENFKRGLPKVGKPVSTSKGCGVMVKHNPLNETTLIRLEDESTIEVRKEDIHGEAPPAPKKNGQKAQPPRKGKRGDKERGKGPAQD